MKVSPYFSLYKILLNIEVSRLVKTLLSLSNKINFYTLTIFACKIMFINIARLYIDHFHYPSKMIITPFII